MNWRWRYVLLLATVVALVVFDEPSTVRYEHLWGRLAALGALVAAVLWMRRSDRRARS